MATKDTEELTDVEEVPEDFEEEEIEDLDDLDDDLDDDELDDDIDDFDDDDSDDEDEEGEHEEETAEALEELESQELKLLDEEAGDALLVDEVKELRAIRREELTMDVDAQGQRSDEFVCQGCFMVKRRSQLANKRKMLCADCAY